jgi:hypothetical protein
MKSETDRGGSIIAAVVAAALLVLALLSIWHRVPKDRDAEAAATVGCAASQTCKAEPATD